MNNNLFLILLIAENALLLIALIIYLTRKCTKCHWVKAIDRIFNRKCETCILPKDPQTEVF